MTRYYKRQGKLQGYKGNSGNHPRYVQATSGKKSKGYNKNQQEPVSFPQQINEKKSDSRNLRMMILVQNIRN